jgi:hypothetical protein
VQKWQQEEQSNPPVRMQQQEVCRQGYASMPASDDLVDHNPPGLKSFNLEAD